MSDCFGWMRFGQVGNIINRMPISGTKLKITQATVYRLVVKIIIIAKTKLARRHLTNRILLFLTLSYILYYFGVFTHLFERDLNELRGPFKLKFNLDVNQVFDPKEKSINEHKLNYTYLHKAEHTCSGGGDNNNAHQQHRPPFLLILIKSKVTQFENRDAIRQTWGQLDEFGIIKKVFLIGIPSPADGDRKAITQRVEAENEKYGDVIQQNFHDVYYNNTIKTFMGIRWVLEFCSEATFYLFIDDDFYLNPKLLMSFLRKNITSSEMYNTLYAGYVFPKASPMRHQISKWYISLREYPYEKFPPYVAAGCVLLTPKSLRLFYMASRMFEIFKFDDIYMGILAYKLDIKPIHIDRVYYYPPTYSPSVYANEVIASHEFTPTKLVHAWMQVESAAKFKPTSYEEFFSSSS